MTNAVCAACRRSIDAAARVCPYCGANPQTGERIDTQALLQEVFRPREVSTSESVLEYARQRQGVVIAITGAIAFLLLAGLHQFVSMRNASTVTNSAAVPLTEVTDLSNQPDETKPMPMPEMNFQYDGRPQQMRTYIIERGATVPPEIIAEQQAAAAAAAAAKAPPPGQQPAAVPQQPGAVAPRPGVVAPQRPQPRPQPPAARPPAR